MNGMFEIFANSFKSNRAPLPTSTSSPGVWVAGTLLTSAIAAMAVYLRYNLEEIFESKKEEISKSQTQNTETVVLPNRKIKLKYVSTRTRLLLKYSKALPTDASESMKQAMGKAIQTFLNLNRRNISHELPESSFFNTVIFADGKYNKNISYYVYKCAECEPKFKLEIVIPENLDDSQWKSIENRLLDWRKPFSLTQRYFG